MATTASGKKRQFSSNKSANPTIKRRRVKRQTDYHSSSSSEESEDDGQLDAQAMDIEPAEANIESSSEANEQDESQQSESDSAEENSDEDTRAPHKKRNDPTAFAVSMSKILNSKLSTAKRSDPVLSRSKDAADAVKEASDARLEVAARRKLKEEKRAKMDVGRIKDVRYLNNPEISTEEIMARERRYKKLAQQGVIRLFNAVLAAQLKGQEASKTAHKEGVVGLDSRKEKVTEMSKQGFLDLIAGGGKK